MLECESFQFGNIFSVLCEVVPEADSTLQEHSCAHIHVLHSTICVFALQVAAGKGPRVRGEREKFFKISR